MVNKALFTSNSEEWATPQKVFDELNKEFEFTLDPCATPQNAKCEKFYTKDEDGLSKSWSGEIVYCNPPYGRQLEKWVRKAYNKTLQGGAKRLLCC